LSGVSPIRSMEEQRTARRLGKMAALGLLLGTWGGCANVVFDEKTNGMDLPALVDDVFTISLPRDGQRPGDQGPTPEILGQSVKFLARGQDESGARDWFKFQATEAGDSEIRISRILSSDLSMVRDYTVKVNVKLCDW